MAGVECLLPLKILLEQSLGRIWITSVPIPFRSMNRKQSGAPDGYLSVRLPDNLSN